MEEHQNSLKTIIANNALSLALFALFVLCIGAQSVSGWWAYNGSLRDAHFPALGFAAYLGTGNFLDGILSNWQAAVLQLLVLIAFGTVLRQKGAPHSRKVASEYGSHRSIYWKFGRRQGAGEWLYANSLSLAFLAMFLVAFGLHVVFGDWHYNEDQALRHLPPIAIATYFFSASFWKSVFECWEAEFAVIAIYIVFSIFLRQENSPESKPVDASNEQTAVANE